MFIPTREIVGDNHAGVEKRTGMTTLEWFNGSILTRMDIGKRTSICQYSAIKMLKQRCHIVVIVQLVVGALRCWLLLLLFSYTCPFPLSTKKKEVHSNNDALCSLSV